MRLRAENDTSEQRKRMQIGMNGREAEQQWHTCAHQMKGWKRKTAQYGFKCFCVTMDDVALE